MTEVEVFCDYCAKPFKVSRACYDAHDAWFLLFTRPRPGEARLMVGVEFYAEDSEVVGKVYDAESRLKYAAEPRDAHLAGSVRATVSRLLSELAAKIAGDPSF